MRFFIPTLTQDGVWLVRDHETGLTASGPTLADAIAELQRLLSAKEAA